MALNFGSKQREGDASARVGAAAGATPAAPSVGSVPASASVPVSLSQTARTPAPAAEHEASKLIVGPNIKLKGVEIADCDTLVVEGSVEASVNSRVIQVLEKGAFKGSAEIDIAEIRGVFDGNLTVRDKLVIFATGKVTGKVRYGKIVIEEGGQVMGEISVDTSAAGKANGGDAASV